MSFASTHLDHLDKISFMSVATQLHHQTFGAQTLFIRQLCYQLNVSLFILNIKNHNLMNVLFFVHPSGFPSSLSQIWLKDGWLSSFRLVYYLFRECLLWVWVPTSMAGCWWGVEIYREAGAAPRRLRPGAACCGLALLEDRCANIGPGTGA